MKAVVLHEPGGPEVLKIESLPVPQPAPGQVLIQVKAFGLNRSELFTRQGHSPGVRFPRVLGIGLVAAAPGGEFNKGDVVATCMGGMLCRVHLCSCDAGAGCEHDTSVRSSRGDAGDAADCVGIALQGASTSEWRHASDPWWNHIDRLSCGCYREETRRPCHLDYSESRARSPAS
jgi:threonine dehydrogenase-like Zn-dependent dehydrogenase